MKWNRERKGQPSWFALTLLLICVSTQEVSADDDATLRLSLHPTSEPVPPLKYRLLPEFREQIAGNATVWYGKVFAEQQALTNHSEFWMNYDRYMKLPLDQLREEEFVAGIAKSRMIYGFLEKAARAQSCDWQLRVREESYYEILLPEVQQTRSFARLLSLRVRFQIAEGDLEGAIRSLQSGFALARNVARGETVVNALIGTAIHRAMTDRVMELVQQPGCPPISIGHSPRCPTLRSTSVPISKRSLRHSRCPFLCLTNWTVTTSIATIGMTN